MKNKFYVVLAIDGAGKSTLLDSVDKVKEWKLVTYDDKYVPKEYEILNVIDNHVEKETLGHFPILGKNFKTSLYSIYIYYMVDLIKNYNKESNVVCNSYYYKLLAKDILQNGSNKLHSTWRKLRKPDKIVFLDTPPEIAAERIVDINNLFPNEYFGDRPTFEGFITFQQKLREIMLNEIKGVETIFIDGSMDKGKIEREMLKVLG